MGLTHSSMEGRDYMMRTTKESEGVKPLQVPEFAVLDKIADEPAFAWWIKDVLHWQDRIISKGKARY
jgi:hypothetical protein